MAVKDGFITQARKILNAPVFTETEQPERLESSTNNIGSDFMELVSQLKTTPGTQIEPIEQQDATQVTGGIEGEALGQLGELPAVRGIVDKVKDVFTGESRTNPEIEAMATIGELPELQGISIAGLKAALSTVTAGPEEAASALKANFPDIQIRQDEQGNYIVKSGISGEEFAVNKPGFDVRDLMQLGINAAIFGASRGSGIASKVGIAGAKQFGIEATQASTGGEFDTLNIPLAAGTELAAPLAGSAIRGVRGLRSPVKSGLEKVVQTTERAGIQPLTSDVLPPKTFAKKGLRALGERVPIIGTGPVRVAQQTERTKAFKNVISEFGGDDIASASDEVMSDLLKTRSKQINKYVTLKKEVIENISDNKNPVTVDNTIDVLDQEIKKLKDLEFSGVSPIISLFNNFKKAIKGKKVIKKKDLPTLSERMKIDIETKKGTIDKTKGQSLGNIELLRKQLGEELEDPSLAAVRSTGKKSLSKIYGALREDMGEFIKETGAPKDFVKWEVANKRLSNLVGELNVNTLKQTLKKGTDTPETVRRMLFSKNPSELRLLHKNLSPAGRKHAKVAIFQEVFDKMGGNRSLDDVTPEKFLNQMGKMTKQVDIFLNREDKKVLSGLMKALVLTRQAGIANVKPPTGAEFSLGATGLGIGWVLGVPAAAPAIIASIGAISRVYESRAVRDLLLRLNKVPKGKGQEILNKLTPLLQSLRQKAQGET